VSIDRTIEDRNAGVLVESIIGVSAIIKAAAEIDAGYQFSV